MPAFDVLTPNLDLSTNRLLEASAGTGKTFTIEHLVIRHLIAEEPIPLPQMLIVTFTRAATAELRERIQQKISDASEQIGTNGDDVPLYLQEHPNPSHARRLLRRALLVFDDAQILTLHGFCQRMLAEEGRLPPSAREMRPTDLLDCARDTFRTQLDSAQLSAAQVEILLRAARNQEEELYRQLVKAASGKVVDEGEPFKKLYQRFTTALTALPHQHYDSRQLIDDFQQLVPLYKGVCDQQKQVHEIIWQGALLFSECLAERTLSLQEFDSLLRLGLGYYLGDRELKARAKPEEVELHYKGLQEAIGQHLAPIVQQAIDSKKNLNTAALAMQRLVEVVSRERGLFRPDALLSMMDEACQDPQFAQRVRERYDVAVVDEFQDTDPVQWRILERLFLVEPKRRLYLVGDPKQAIYAFRDADIYTYLNASQALGKGAHATLDTNYRSEPALVDALNTLFSGASDLFPLPRTDSSLPFHRVQAGREKPKIPLQDGRGSVHLLLTEGGLPRKGAWPPKVLEQRLFQAIAHEIVHMRDQGIPYQDQAVLVRDRYQGSSLEQALRGWGIPVRSQHAERVGGVETVAQLRHLLIASLQPQDFGKVSAALLGGVFRWNPQRLEQCQNDSHQWQQVVAVMDRLRTVLYQRGIAHWWRVALSTRWGESSATVEEQLAALGERALLADLQQLVELFAEESALQGLRGAELLRLFGQVARWEEDADPRLERRWGQDADAVQTLTLHMSKGLEFPVVYALGLTKRTPAPNSDDPLAAAEIDAEKLRQLYVAMTRAGRRLYLPVALESGCPLRSDGTASPMELFLERLMAGMAGSGEMLRRWVDAQTASITSSGCEVDVVVQQDEEIAEAPPHPKEPSLSLKSLQLTSFTALSRHDDEWEPQWSIAPPPEGVLPAGVETGRVLHTLLEQVPSIGYEMSINELATWMENRRGPWDLMDPYRQQLVEITHAALKAPLLSNGGGLMELSPEQCWRELDFVYADQGNRIMRGAIDLVAQDGEGYLLVDWKSHWLGNRAKDYRPDRLATVVKRHQYTLQGNIYREAWSRQLQQLGIAEGYAIRVLFVFVRGLAYGNTQCWVEV